MADLPAATKIRTDLDAAIAAALPVSGGRIRPLLHQLRNELDRVDEERAAVAKRQEAWLCQAGQAGDAG